MSDGLIGAGINMMVFAAIAAALGPLEAWPLMMGGLVAWMLAFVAGIVEAWRKG
jgi:hypothetical protein